MGHELADDAAAGHSVEAMRQGTLCVVLASIAIAAVIILASGIAINADGVAAVAFLIAAALVAAVIGSSRARLVRVGDCLGALGQMWLGGLASGVIAIMGLRAHMPLADRALFKLDRALGVDALSIVNWLAAQPKWLMSVLSASYFHTIPFLYLSFVVLALLGDRLEVWRGAFCFVGTVLSTCVISIVAPAKGLGVWASPRLIALLPQQSIRHFWPAFENFYDGAHPVLQLNAIGGVVSFPSFHTIMGLIAVAMWRKHPIIFVPASVCLLVMLVATLPFGGHYIVDLLAGSGLWGLWFALSQRIEQRSRCRVGRMAVPRIAAIVIPAQ